MSTQSEKATSRLAVDVVNDATRLIRQEGELVRAEMKENVKDVAIGLGSLGVAVAITIASLTVVLIALAAALVTWFGIEVWVAQALAGGIGLLIGAALLSAANAKLSAVNLAPTKTARNIQRDMTAVKESF